MTAHCGCYHGGPCTRSTVCAVESVREDLALIENERDIYRAQLAAVVTAMRRADPEWCACHGETPIDDESWDAVLGAAEDCLDDSASGTEVKQS